MAKLFFVRVAAAPFDGEVCQRSQSANRVLKGIGSAALKIREARVGKSSAAKNSRSSLRRILIAVFEPLP
jgi:hypothetical protein